MRVLTVRQPWAALIASERKPVEFRTWRTNYRGPLAIQAGLHVPPTGDLERHGLDPARVDYGAILCVTTLRDVVPYDAQVHAAMACLPTHDRHGYAWRLGPVRPLLHPEPFQGGQGLLRVNGALRDRLLALHAGLLEAA